MPHSSNSINESINESIAEDSLSDDSVSSALRRALTALETGDFQTRWEAAKLISGCGLEAARNGSPERVIKPLLHLLETDDEDEISWYVARILGTFDHPLALQGLTHLLQTSQSPDVAGMAATALVNCGAAAIPPLTELLRHPEMKLMAIRALAQIQHPDVVPILLTLAADSLPAVRSTAIDALSRFSDPAISDILLAALHDPDGSVRRSAVSALGFQAQILSAAPNSRQPFKTDLHALVDALQPLLWDLDLEVCCQTALTLGRIGTAEAIARLGKVLLLHSTPVLLQQAIIRAIAWNDTAAAVACLHEALFDPILPQDSQFEMITVLGRLRSLDSSQAAIETLLDLLHRQHPLSQISKGKQTIAHSLGQLATVLKSSASVDLELHQELTQQQARKLFSKMMTVLIGLLDDPDAGVQLHVIAALNAFDDHPVNSALTSRLQDENITAALREGIATALTERRRSIK